MEKDDFKTAIIEITYNCNLRCSHCYLEKHDAKEQSLEYWKNVISLLSKKQTDILILSGGEPLLYENFDELLLFAKLKGMRTCLFTNSLLLSKNIQKIENAGLDKICISIYGAEPDIHDKITGVAESFNSLINSLKIINKSKILIELRMIVMSSNISQVEYVMDLSNKFNCNLRLDGRLIDKLFYEKSLDDIRINKHICDVLKQKIASIDNNIGIVPLCGSCHGGCRAYDKLLVFGSDGTIYPCSKIRKEIAYIKNDRFYPNEIVLKKLNELKSTYPLTCLYDLKERFEISDL